MAGKGWLAAGLGLAALIWWLKREHDVATAFDELMGVRGLRPQDEVPRVVRSWTDAELVRELDRAVGPRSRVARAVFALAYVEQGENHVSISFNCWGVEAFGPGPSFGWKSAPPYALGWARALEAGTGLYKPFLSWPNWSTALRFMSAIVQVKGLYSVDDYKPRWNPVLPESREKKVRERWALGEQLYDRLSGSTMGVA